MKIIKPDVQEVTDFEGVDNFYKAVARAARICYASDKTDNDKELCERLIKSGHFSPFEHAIVYCYITPNNKISPVLESIINDKYAIKVYRKNSPNNILGVKYAINGRIIAETVNRINNSFVTMDSILNEIKFLIESIDLSEKELKLHHFIKFKSFIVDTSIGCTREMNRHHNNFYICEQSTRFCNYSKDKFGNEIALNKPYWLEGHSEAYIKQWLETFESIEKRYIDFALQGTSTDELRGLLPLDTHTRAIYTATIEEWQHIIDLRLKGTTGKPHGDIKVIAEKIDKLIHHK